MSSKRALLIIEDDPGLQSQLKWSFDDFDVTVAGDREAALVQFRRTEPHVVTLDLGLPPDPANATEGLATLGDILSIAPQTKVVVVTGNDDRDNAIRAIGMGAYDFYQKPIDPDVLTLIVERAYQLRELEIENTRLSSGTSATPIDGVIAVSEEMRRVCRTIEKVASADVSVLLLGESGTGKEVLTQALHKLSPRRKERIVAINCAAIPENLLESELFGYEKGAFTGANKLTLGKIELANKGTLFLDEIGDLPMSLQAKLLRFLQERTVERLGGREEIPVDVRVVCATHQNIESQIQTGEFREDLYYRISEITVKIPPLRDRPGDVLVLANAFLRRFAKEHGRNIRGLSESAEAAITSYPWPGNARELENRIKRAVIMADSNVVSSDDLELTSDGADQLPINLRHVREIAEIEAIRRALLLADGKIASASELLGVSRPTLYDLMQKHGLKA